MIPVRKDIGGYGREWKGSWHPSFPGWFRRKLDITLNTGFFTILGKWFYDSNDCFPAQEFKIIQDFLGSVTWKPVECNIGLKKINPWPSNASSLNLVCCWFLVQFELYCFWPKVIVLIFFFLAKRPQIKRIGLMSRFILKTTFWGLSQTQALHMTLEGQG